MSDGLRFVVAMVITTGLATFLGYALGETFGLWAIVPGVVAGYCLGVGVQATVGKFTR